MIHSKDRAVVATATRRAAAIWMRVTEGLGTLTRTAVLGSFGSGFAFAFALSGGPSVGGVLALICGALTAVVAATLNLVFYAMIGLSAFFIEDTSPVYWVWQKLSVVFGGLIFPLDVYPSTLQKLADATPFPSLLYAPGRIAIGAEPMVLSRSTLHLAAWGAVMFAARFAYRRVRRALTS